MSIVKQHRPSYSQHGTHDHDGVSVHADGDSQHDYNDSEPGAQ